MLEQLLVFEREAFLWLNGLHAPYWDQFFWLYSGKVVWLPLAAFLLCVLAYRKPWREVVFLFLAIALTIMLCDQFASHLCKPLCARFRPTHHPDFQDLVHTVNGYRGGLYGFISSHAANSFGLATLLTLILRDKLLGATLFFWAAVNAYSRIYLGVHFLSDIIPGACVGLLFGYLVYRLYRWRRPALTYSPRRIAWMTGAVWATIACLLLYPLFA